MLRGLQDLGVLQVRNMPDDKPQNTQGNVDNLMLTLTAMSEYGCFIKIDDDVLIERGSDDIMVKLLMQLELQGVHMLMGQVVREHINHKNPFEWETDLLGYHVAQRSRKACPMETYTAVTKNALPLLRKAGVTVSCDNARGTYGMYTKNLTALGHKVCVVLEPHIRMQHIGLTTTIDTSGAARSWAPARSWNPVDKVIEVAGFDFDKWEASHHDATQREATLEILAGLVDGYPAEHAEALQTIIECIKEYSPGQGDVGLPPDPRMHGSASQETPVVVRKELRAKQLAGKKKVIPQVLDKNQAALFAHEPVHVDVRRARDKQRAAIAQLPNGQLVRKARTPQSVVVRGGK